MFDGTRLRNLMALRGISQSELARRVGVSQTTIAKLVRGTGYGSRYLHRIARELGTTPAYLEGEIDDPGDQAAQPVSRPSVSLMMLPVVFPAEEALIEMFAGLLEVVDLTAPKDELARELAQLLPTAMLQLRGLYVDAQSRVERQGEPIVARATVDPELTR